MRGRTTLSIGAFLLGGWVVIDDFCKQLVSQHPESVSRWVLSVTQGTPAPVTQGWQLLDRELSSAPLHADSVVLLPQAEGASILHLEFQTRPDRRIAERMLEYWIRLHRRFHQPILQTVIHLKPTSSRLAWIEQLKVGGTRHKFSTLRLWEQDPEPLLADPTLLPLAVLARDPSHSGELLRRVGQRLQAITEPNQKRITTSGCQLLAGLAFSPDVVQRLLAMSILEDSSVYQLIKNKALEAGRAEGLAEGRIEGRAEGRAEGLIQGRQSEAAGLLLRLLQRRCGALSEQQQDLILCMPLECLEQLGDAVLDFQSPADLEGWLNGRFSG